jgi:hypothetical protein
MAKFVDDHEHAKDQDEQDDRDEGLNRSGHGRPPTEPVGVDGPDLVLEGDSSSIPGSPGLLAAAKALDRGLEQPRDAREIERSGEEAGDGHLVRGDQRGRCPRPHAAGLAGDPERREALSSGARKSSRPRRQIGAGRR